MYKNKVLLVTGGTGSFGNAVVNHFLDSELAEIRILSRDEKKQDDMRKLYNNRKLKFFLGDIRDFSSVDNAMKGVDYLFHAAALKQVPSCEFFPLEAVKTNVLGSENVLNAAIGNDVKKSIFLSTDKAVNPINVMGMSKAMMEKLVVAKARSTETLNSILTATRYGNVMGSRGSVIPLFIEQIKQSKPITITDPDMTRFMMTLDESVNLVLYAFKNADSGDVFVQKSPSASIITIAEALIDLFNSSSPIKIIGTRHAEKKHETLCSREEMSKAIDMGNFYRIPADGRDLNYEIFLEQGDTSIDDTEEYNSSNTHVMDVEEVKSLLTSLDFVKKELM
jgi:UDP-glucose 4-epimerase